MKTKKILIRATNIHLKKFEKKHITTKYISSLNDKNLTKYSYQSLIEHDYNSCVNYIKKIAKEKNILLGVFLNDTSEQHLGNITISFFNYNNSADIAIIMLKEHSGKGYALESFQALFKYLFSDMNVRKITVGTCVENKRMINLAIQAGMTKDGIRKKHYVLGDFEYDIIHFAKFKN